MAARNLQRKKTILWIIVDQFYKQFRLDFYVIIPKKEQLLYTVKHLTPSVTSAIDFQVFSLWIDFN